MKKQAKGVKTSMYDFSKVTLQKVKEFKNMKEFLREKSKVDLLNEVLRRFKAAGCTVEHVVLPNSDYDVIYLINKVPMILSLNIDETIAFLDEQYWVNQIPNLNNSQKRYVIKYLPGSLRFTDVDSAVSAIKDFLKEYPIYASDSLTNLDSKTGVFERIKTFKEYSKIS